MFTTAEGYFKNLQNLFPLLSDLQQRIVMTWGFSMYPDQQSSPSYNVFRRIEEMYENWDHGSEYLIEREVEHLNHLERIAHYDFIDFSSLTREKLFEMFPLLSPIKSTRLPRGVRNTLYRGHKYGLYRRRIKYVRDLYSTRVTQDQLLRNVDMIGEVRVKKINLVLESLGLPPLIYDHKPGGQNPAIMEFCKIHSYKTEKLSKEEFFLLDVVEWGNLDEDIISVSLLRTGIQSWETDSMISKAKNKLESNRF